MILNFKFCVRIIFTIYDIKFLQLCKFQFRLPNTNNPELFESLVFGIHSSLYLIDKLDFFRDLHAQKPGLNWIQLKRHQPSYSPSMPIWRQLIVPMSPFNNSSRAQLIHASTNTICLLTMWNLVWFSIMAVSWNVIAAILYLNLEKNCLKSVIAFTVLVLIGLIRIRNVWKTG